MKKLILIVGIFLLILLTILATISSNTRDMVDSRIIHIDKQIVTIDQGLLYAEKRAHQWRKDALFEKAFVDYADNREITNTSKKVYYYFTVSNDSEYKPVGVAEVVVDLKKNSIVQFTVHYGIGLKAYDYKGFEFKEET